jgi:hypothetical protein
MRIEYFDAGGTQALQLSYEGPGVPRQIVPPHALWH